jgi:hypothetical protein
MFIVGTSVSVHVILEVMFISLYSDKECTMTIYIITHFTDTM